MTETAVVDALLQLMHADSTANVIPLNPEIRTVVLIGRHGSSDHQIIELLPGETAAILVSRPEPQLKPKPDTAHD